MTYHTPCRPQPADYKAAMAWWAALREAQPATARALRLRSCDAIFRYYGLVLGKAARWMVDRR